MKMTHQVPHFGPQLIVEWKIQIRTGSERNVPQSPVGLEKRWYQIPIRSDTTRRRGTRRVREASTCQSHVCRTAGRLQEHRQRDEVPFLP